MALTPGHTNSEGLRYRTFDPVASILRCFRCHSTGTLRLDAALSVQPSELGVHCESCHGPGAAHVKSPGAKGTIRNPGKLNGVSLNVFCGGRHRKPPEAGEATNLSNAWNTRRQPDDDGIVHLSREPGYPASRLRTLVATTSALQRWTYIETCQFVDS